MGVLRAALVLLATLALGLSFAVPAEDVLETPYDESESLPYEMTSLSGDLVQESVLTLQVSPIVPAGSFSTHRDASGWLGRRELPAHHNSESLIILDRTFRC
jgi:hypothetical protein